MEVDRAQHMHLLHNLRARQRAVATIRAATPGGEPARWDDDDLQAQERSERSAKNGGDVNAVGPRGTTPLLMACSEGMVADVRLLLDARADVKLEGVEWKGVGDDEEPAQDFPLAAAARRGHPDVVGMLLVQEGMDVNQGTTDAGRTAMLRACCGGHKEVVGMLLAYEGIDANKGKTDDGTTSLLIACQEGHTEVVGLLLACDGVDVNKATTDDGSTPLYMACQDGHTEVVGLLLACDGVDVNKARTDDGATPLLMACQDGHTEVVGLLLACDGVDVNKATTDDGATPLYLSMINI
jgi:ankyrin repeat protein